MGNEMDVVKRIIYAIILSSVFTMIVSPTLSVSLFFSYLAWLLMLIMYYDSKNAVFFRKSMAAYGGLCIGFVSMKLLMGYQIRYLYMQEKVFLILLVIELLLSVKCSVCKQSKLGNDNLFLYSEREYDLERIKKFIQSVNILGINASWGMGKTFLMQCLEKDMDIKINYEIIQIDLLSCDLDQVEVVLIEEIERIFENNRIYPNHSRGMKKILGKSKWAELLGGLILDSREGMATTFKDYKREFQKLPKKILVVFEDIDRITEKNTIQKIFAIVEKLVDEKLHVVYHYDETKLEEVGFSRFYLEKYIPYTVNLTEIPYEKIIDYQWEELGMSKTVIKKEDVRQICMRAYNRYQLQKILGFDVNVSMQIRGVSIRNVQSFLNELKVLINDNPEFQKEKVIDIVISVIFIKHFFWEYYKRFRMSESPLHYSWFSWEGQTYTMNEVLVKFGKMQNKNEEEREKQITELQMFMERKENKEALILLMLLGYNMQLKQIGQEMEDYVTEPSSNLERKAQNEKIDHVLWNVLGCGTSEITDTENALKKLIEEVIYKKGKDREQAWNRYRNDMYNGRLWKDNSTIFMIGVDTYLPLFRALKVCNASSKDWEAFLDFYFYEYEKRKGKTITIELVDNLNYCDTHNKKILFQVIRFFNRLQVERNMNRDKSYKIFLENYMGAIATLGYCERMEYWMFQFAGLLCDKLEHINSSLQQLKEELVIQMEKQQLQFVKEEFAECIRFVEKNQELVQSKECMKERGPSVHITEMSSKWSHQEEVNRLKELKKKSANGEEQWDVFESRLKKSYQEGNLFLPELKDVMKDD